MAVPAAAAETSETTAALAQPAAEQVPLPRSRPRHFATVASRIPLPRPKPAEISEPESDLPSVDRHAIN
jgi:hypothetical protein